MELVSPACSPEAVIASVQSGADAVYMIFGGARDGIFTEADFAKSVRYARIRDCRVYLELGCIFADSELRMAAELAAEAADLGVSAIVVQDIGMVSVVRSVAPDMPVHGGERLGFNNLAGIEAAAQTGISRVRLSQQTSLREIAAISANCSVELEAEIFGSACFSRPGLCYFGAMSGEGSANMGACAGQCRGDFSMGGRLDDKPMALKDINYLSSLHELEECGISAVRIGLTAERPEAAALLTETASKCLKEGRVPSPAENERISIAFSRREFTDSYLKGETEDVFGIRPAPEKDAEKIFAEVRKRYADSELRRVPVGFYAVLARGSSARLTAQDREGHRATVFGPRPLSSGGSLMTELGVKTEFYKTGGTPYLCAGVRTLIDDGVSMAPDDLGNMRRAVLRKLSEQRCRSDKVRTGPFPPMPAAHKRADAPLMIFQIMSEKQLAPELSELKPDYIYAPLDIICSSPQALRLFTDAGTVPVAVLPAVITDPEAAAVYELLLRAKANGVTQALCAGLGHAALARKAGCDVRADFCLNLHNSFALDWAAKAGFLSAAVSVELRIDQIKELSKPLDTEMIVYGRIPVMVSDRCIIKRSTGRCSCAVPSALSNGTGSVYPVMKEYGCRNKVMAGEKIFLADRWQDCAAAGLWGARLVFSTESARECAEVAKRYLGISRYRPNGLTRGLYYKGV